jgi:hypothetical protein
MSLVSEPHTSPLYGEKTAQLITVAGDGRSWLSQAWSMHEGGDQMAGNGKDDDAETKDGGRHDVSRDGETGKTTEDIDPNKYGIYETDDE